MYNLLIADDNIRYIKKLANTILSQSEEVRLVKIATNGEETYNYIKSGKIDLVLLDLYMPFLTGLEVLEKLYKDNIINFPKIIIISGYPINVNKLVNKYNIVEYIQKGIGLETIVKKIKNIISNMNQEQSMKFVLRELTNLKYNFKHNGTTYIYETILLIIDSNDICVMDNLEKNVYSILAKRYNKSINNIKSSIVKATNIMYNECRMEYLLKYFSFENDTKPTPKLVISTIINNYINQIKIDK